MRRAFTLIELLIVMVMIGILGTALVCWLGANLQIFSRSRDLFDMRNQAQLVAARAFRGQPRVGEDNQSLWWADGSHLGLEQGRLVWHPATGPERTLTTDTVGCFTAVVRDGRLTLNLELEHSGQNPTPLRYRVMFDREVGP